MGHLEDRIRQMCDGLPDGASVMLPVGWLRSQLDGPDPSHRVVIDWTVRRVAEELERAPSTVRTWLNRGLIPEAYQLRGREWRVPPAAVRAFQDREGDQPERPSHRDPDGPVDLGSWRDVQRENGGAP